MDKIWDVSIIGAGPAGLTAAIYGQRYGLDNIVFGLEQGGTITNAHKVCNFPGQIEINGDKLATSFLKHARKEGCKFKQERIIKINSLKPFELKGNLGNDYKAKNIILALGDKRRKLGLKNEGKFLGKGLSYCATCDGNFFQDKKVAVVGGSDAAVTAALYLSDIAHKVYLIYRRDQLRCVPSWEKQLKKQDNVEVIYNSNVLNLIGKNKLEKIKLSNKYKGKNLLLLDGLFIEIGSVPNTKIARDMGVETDKQSYIKIDQKGKTNLENVWAAGDATNGLNKFKQVLTAAAEGAVAANNLYTQFKTRNN